jgi:hypothetical protein
MRKLLSAVMLLAAVSLTGCSSNGGTPPTCTELCPDVVAAGCSAGPANEAACESGCMVIEQSCQAQYDDYAACGGASPTITCNASNFPIVTGCEAKSDALLACLATSGN